MLAWYYGAAKVPVTLTNTPAAETRCQQDPMPTDWVDFPVKIINVDKKEEIITLQNVSDTTIHLDTWTMCSFRGSQQHPIAGDLLPGETKTFPNTDEDIWSNSQKDTGGLYNSAGELISYWKD